MPSRSDEHEFLNWALQNDRDAVDLVQRLFRVSQVLDDLVDKDCELSDLQVYAAFFECLVLIPANPAYQKHFPHINPLLGQYLQDWFDATQMERSGIDHHRRVAFGLRSNLGGVVTQLALLIGGFEWMQQVAPAVRDHIHCELFEDYERELSGGEHVR
jgi:hypothetical protein